MQLTEIKQTDSERDRDPDSEYDRDPLVETIETSKGSHLQFENSLHTSNTYQEYHLMAHSLRI